MGILSFIFTLFSPPPLLAQTPGFAHVLTYDSLRLAPADRKRAEKLRLSSSGTVELVDFAEITSKMRNGYLAFSLVKGETPQLFIPTQLRYRGPSDYVWQGRTADGDRVCRLKSTPEGISGLYLDYANDLTARIIPGTDSTSILVSTSFSGVIGAECGTETPTLPPVIQTCTNEPCPGNITILFLFTPETNPFTSNIKDKNTVINFYVNEIETTWGNSQVDNTITAYYADFDTFSFSPYKNKCCSDERDEIRQLPEYVSLREQYKADITVIFAEEKHTWADNTTSDNCASGGCAFIGAANADESIVLMPVDGYLVDENPYTFSHEVGHVFGAHHRQDWYQEDNDPNYLEFCAFGYPLQSNHATVMYTGQKPNGQQPMRIPYFSDPGLSYFSSPMGDDQHNSAGRIRQRGCTIANFQPDLEIHSFIDIASPACDELILEANSQGPAAALSYEWRWSYDGLFTTDSPGISLGWGQQLPVVEPVDDPCRSYFVALFTYLNGEEVAFTTKRIRGGACVDNVWCPSAGEKSGSVDKKTPSTMVDRQLLYNLSGQLLLTIDRAPWLNEPRRSTRFAPLPPGIYFVRTRYADGAVSTHKIFLGND